jgi:hypothetical protein
VICGLCSGSAWNRVARCGLHEDIDLIHPVEILGKAQLTFNAMTTLESPTRCKSENGMSCT